MDQNNNTDLTIINKYQGPLKRFTDNAKVKFLELYKDKPNIGRIAREMGLSRNTIQRHLKTDEAFKIALQDIKDEHLDTIEEYMYSRSMEKSGFMDRIALLRAYRAQFRDQVKHDHKMVPNEVVNSLYEKAKAATPIDAQVIDVK